MLDLPGARKMSRAFGTPKKIDAEFAALKKQNLARVAGFSLTSPNENFNRLFSVWLKHQLYLMADWARFYFKGYPRHLPGFGRHEHH